VPGEIVGPELAEGLEAAAVDDVVEETTDDG
jgi:hypothetical protein